MVYKKQRNTVFNKQRKYEKKQGAASKYAAVIATLVVIQSPIKSLKEVPERFCISNTELNAALKQNNQEHGARVPKRPIKQKKYVARHAIEKDIVKRTTTEFNALKHAVNSSLARCTKRAAAEKAAEETTV